MHNFATNLQGTSILSKPDLIRAYNKISDEEKSVIDHPFPAIWI